MNGEPIAPAAGTVFFTPSYGETITSFLLG